MAETNLQDYVVLIEAQLRGGAADEASYHARHILGQYPRYTPAFRLLGRALLLKGQLAEAEAAFRRVLSVEPADITAHLGLSEIYDQRHRGDEAIWHAERAMETEIANAVTTDLLRSLYRRYRGEEQPRMALTAVALTRQALQNQDYTLAVATLRDALERHPERADLRLLLAEALWESGDHVAAAETARDVQETLPDCFSANAMLTRLWLEVGRPSDARPYLNRLEALDPYAAVLIASGQPADPNAFTIDMLDYQRSAQSDAARAAPEWLDGIPAEATVEAQETEWTSGMLAAAAAENESEPVETEVAEAESDDLLTQVVPAAMTGAAAAGLFAMPAFDEEDEPELPALDAAIADDESSFAFDEATPTLQLPVVPAPADVPDFPAAESDYSADLDALFSDEIEQPAGFVSPFDESEPEATPVPSSGATNPLPPLEPAHDRAMPPAEDAMAWLRESGVELVDDEAPAFSTETGEEFPTAAPHDQSDPMAWLNTYDSVLEETPAESELPPASTVILEDGWEFDIQEADPNSPELFADNASEAEAAPETPATSGSLRGLTSRLGDPSITPAAIPPAAAVPLALGSDASEDEWQAQFDDNPATAEAAADSPDWLTDLGAVMTTEPDATPAAPDEHGEPLPTPEADESAAWLSEFSPEGLAADMAALPDGANSEMPDWLMENAPDEVAAAAEANVDVPADDADVLPDWLVENAPDASAAVAGLMAADQFGGEAEPASEGFDWLNTLNASDSEPSAELDEAVMAAQADVPDWLNALEAEALAQIDANQSQSDLDEFEEIEIVELEVSGEPLPFDEPAEAEMLAEATFEDAQAEEASVEVEPIEEAGELAAAALTVDAIADQQDDELSFEGEPVEEAGELAAGALTADAIADEQDDGMSFGAGAVAAGVWIAGAALPVDALSDEPDDAQQELSPEDWGEPEQADLSRIAPPTVSVEGDEPLSRPDVAPGDWYADAELAAEVPAPDDGTLVAMPTDDWFEDTALLAPVDAAVEPVAEMTQLGADTVVLAASEQESDEDGLPLVALGGAAAIGVLALAADDGERETEASEAAVLNAGEDDEWLMTEWPEDADGQQLQPDELDELPDADIVEETVIAPAENAPDWLNAMVPGLDMDYEVSDDEAGELDYAAENTGALDETLGARSEYGWVIDLVEQEELETEAAPVAVLAEAEGESPRFVFRTLPAWFKHSSSDGSDDDFADWPSDNSSLQAWQN